MASCLRRCRRCGQAVLGDARCCPHCAVPRPARRRLVRGLVLGAAAAAVIGSGLRGGREGAGDARAETGPSLWGAMTGLFDEPPAEAACRRRGGTPVRVPGSWLGAVRCAIGFDDGAAP